MELGRLGDRAPGKAAEPGTRSHEACESETDEIRLDARPAGVAANGRRRSVFAVLGGSLSDATSPDRVHEIRLADVIRGIPLNHAVDGGLSSVSGSLLTPPTSRYLPPGGRNDES
jgi:hypothetical protein